MSTRLTKITKKDRICKQKITRIEKTKDTLTGRGGLALFIRYLSGIGIYSIIEKFFGRMRKSRKGVAIGNIFKQLIAFFVDGTEIHLTRFDTLSKDKGYTEIIENDKESMVSSHSIKRFFNSFSYVRIWLFRRFLQELFIWRLEVERPDIIKLGIDTTVMENNDAVKREGVQPTYRKVKGFQPLQLNWKGYIIDAVFRGGKKHSNYGNTVMKMVGHIVKKIRNKYKKDVPIIIRMDSGFFDQVNFKAFESLEIGYICGGKIYDDIKGRIEKFPEERFGRYSNKDNIWEYTEFMDKRGTWDRERRAIYLKPSCNEEKQMLFEFARPDTIIYTNLGVDEGLRGIFVKAGKEDYFNTETIIETYHQRGSDELVNRALKEFGTERMPFKRFESNSAFYYTMVVAFFLYEAFKRDVGEGIINVKSYANTFRRVLIDFAAKIVHSGGEIIMKVTETVWEKINISTLWIKCNSPPVIPTA